MSCKALKKSHKIIIIIKVIVITIMREVSFRGKSTGCGFTVAHRDFRSSGNVLFLDLCGGLLYNNLLRCILTFYAFYFFPLLNKNVLEPGDNIRIYIRAYYENEMKPCRALRICLVLCKTLVNVSYLQ